eukprot:bmy_01274T0
MSVGEVKGMPSITAVKQGTVAPKWSQRREPESKWLRGRGGAVWLGWAGAGAQRGTAGPAGCRRRPRWPAGHAGVSASMMKKRTSHKKHRSSVGPSKPVSQPRRNIVGCRIQHGWKEGNGPITQWKGTVLDQVPGIYSVLLLEMKENTQHEGLETMNGGHLVQCLKQGRFYIDGWYLSHCTSSINL